MPPILCWYAVGALIWVTIMTQPDLSYPTHLRAKFSQNTGPTHLKATRKALEYLRHTKDKGIT